MQAIGNFNVSSLLTRRVVSTTGVFLATCCISLTASGQTPTATTPTQSTTQVAVTASTQAVTVATPVAAAPAASAGPDLTPPVPPAPSYPCGFSVDPTTKPITIMYKAGPDKNMFGRFQISGAVASGGTNSGQGTSAGSANPGGSGAVASGGINSGGIIINASNASPLVYTTVSVKFHITGPGIDPIDVTIDNVKYDPSSNQFSILPTLPATDAAAAADAAALQALIAASNAKPDNQALKDAVKAAQAKVDADANKANLDPVSRAIAAALNQSVLFNLYKSLPPCPLTAVLTIIPDQKSLPAGVAPTTSDCVVQGYVVFVLQQSF